MKTRKLDEGSLHRGTTHRNRVSQTFGDWILLRICLYPPSDPKARRGLESNRLRGHDMDVFDRLPVPNHYAG